MSQAACAFSTTTAYPYPFELVDLGRRRDQRVRDLLRPNPFWTSTDRLEAVRTADRELRAYLADARSLDATDQRHLCRVLAQMALIEADACQSGEAEGIFHAAADALGTAADKLEEAEDAENRWRPTKNQQLHLYGCAEPAEAAA